jgi:plastocyanin
MHWPSLIRVWRNPKQPETRRVAATLRVSEELEREKNMKRTMLVLSFAVLALASLALSAPRYQALLVSAQENESATAAVKIDNFSFGPATLTVAVGTTVTWVNHDDIPHNVVSTDGLFKSKVMDTDEKFSFTFTKAGTFPYFCGIHPKMTGKVVVQ